MAKKNQLENTIPVVPSKFNSINFGGFNIMNSVTYSNSYFKVIGLKCDIEELPESLYFMMNPETYFRLPMPTMEYIERYDLTDNIALIEKILSFFEIEEIKPHTSRYREVDSEIEKFQRLTYVKHQIPETSFVVKEVKREALSYFEKQNIDTDLKDVVYGYMGRRIREISNNINKMNPDNAKQLYSEDLMNFVYYCKNLHHLDFIKFIETKSPASKKTKQKKDFDSTNTKSKIAVSAAVERLLSKSSEIEKMFNPDKISVSYIKDYEYKTSASGLFKAILCMANVNQIDDDDMEYYTNGGFIYLDKELAESEDSTETINLIKSDYIKFLSDHIFVKNSEAASSLHRVLTSEPENKYIIREVLTPLFPFRMENDEYYPASINGSDVELEDFYDEQYKSDCNSPGNRYSVKYQSLLNRHSVDLYAEIVKFVDEFTRTIYSGSNYLNLIPDQDERTKVQLATDIESLSSNILSKVGQFRNSNELWRFLSCPMFCYDYMTKESIFKNYESHIGIEWSEPLTRVTQFSPIDIKNSIKTRYYFTDQNFIDRQNMVIDSCVPKLLYSANMDFEDAKSLVKGSSNISTLYKRTMYAISPLTAELFNCNQIPIEHLCRVLGYTKQDIKNLMTKTKDAMLNIAFIGAGGTCANTAIWLHQMQKMCNIPYLFAKVFCYEEDSLEIHNLLRFPKDPYSHSYDKHLMSYDQDTEKMTNKIHYISKELEALSKTIPTLERRFIATAEPSDSSAIYPHSLFTQDQNSVPVKDDTGKVIDFKTELSCKIKANTVIYGAPTIETRRNLSNCKGFISATHSDSSCSIWINPEQEADIQVESYGMIQLTSFFMNQLRMAIGLLEILAADNRNELLFSDDNNFLNYSFTQDNALSNDRVYNFKVEANAAMVNDEQAETAF